MEELFAVWVEFTASDRRLQMVIQKQNVHTWTTSCVARKIHTETSAAVARPV